MYYVVDERNHIVAVDADWDDFLVRNGGDRSALAAQVLGRPLESFMAGDVTKMFVRASLDAVRVLGQARSLPYRCDGPGERRQFEMCIDLDGPGRLRVAHRLLWQAPHPAATARRAAVAPLQVRWRCSQCLAVRLGGSATWIEVDDAPQGGAPATDVCPRCAERLFA